MRKWALLPVMLLTFSVSFSSKIQAHPGRTDSSGCHTCRTNCTDWGLSYGEYHCHNGGSVYIAPIRTATPVISTPKPSTSKPTAVPTKSPTPLPTLASSPTNTPVIEPEVKSATTVNPPYPVNQSENTKVNIKDALLGFGIFATLIGGAILIARKTVFKIINTYKK